MREAFRVIGLMLALALMLSLQGCEAPAAVAYVLAGEPKVPAIYELDNKKMTVIMVEDDENLMGDPTSAGLVAATATLLLEEDAGFEGKMIQPRELVDLRREKGESAWRKMDLAPIAREVGAEQIVYAKIAHVDAAANDELLQARMGLRVRVIDATTGTTLFPKNPSRGYVDDSTPTGGHPLLVNLGHRQPRFNKAHQTVITQALSEEAGTHLGQMFYDWKPPQTGDVFK